MFHDIFLTKIIRSITTIISKFEFTRTPCHTSCVIINYKNTPNPIRAPMAGPRCYFNNPNPMSGAYGSSYVYGKSGAIKRTISRIFETPILITNQKIIDHADTIPLGIRRLFSSRCIRRTTPLGAATDIGFLRNYELLRNFW